MREITGLREPAYSLSDRFDDNAERRQARAVGVSAAGLAVTGLVEPVTAVRRSSRGHLHLASYVPTSLSATAVPAQAVEN